jgi:hypothetical protein
MLTTGIVVAGSGMATGSNGPQRISVLAQGYAFTGMPDEIPAGMKRLSFENISQDEEHEMILFRFHDGVTETPEQFADLDEAEYDKKADFFGFGYAGPAERQVLELIGNFPAGRYGMVCMITQGGAEDGVPHYKLGMAREFRVV